jgi:glucose-1-phosphate cytidylyltransferase
MAGEVTNFAEKPQSEEWVNGGFFVFESEIFEYLDSDSALENQPMERLVNSGQLGAYRHTGFWRPMDTFRESKELNELYKGGQAPWVNWK